MKKGFCSILLNLDTGMYHILLEIIVNQRRCYAAVGLNLIGRRARINLLTGLAFRYLIRFCVIAGFIYFFKEQLKLYY